LGLLPVDAKLLEEPSRKRAPYTPFLRQLPAQPPLLSDGYVPVADPDNASHRLQLSWQMGAQPDEPNSANDLLMLRFYRLLFALEANSDAIRWVRSFDHDLVGAAMQEGGLWLADSAGQVSWLDPSGATHFSVALERNVRVITLRPGSYLPPSAAASAAPTGSLREQLFAAASLDDDRLAAGRAFAAQSLSRFPETEATANLVFLCAEAKFPEPLRAAACGELIGRKNGEASVLAALRVRASFLEGTPAPPVGPLAQAAAKMQIKQAGPLLVSHIEDPNTSSRDLVGAFQAIETLGERSSAPSVERFVRLHHAEPEGSELAPPLAAALHALGALRSARERATLVDIAADPLTPKSTRDEAQAALAISDAPPPPKAAGEKLAPPNEAPPQDEVQTDPRPYALTPELVRKTLGPLRDRLGRCLAVDPSHPRSGRTSLVIDGQGRVEGVFVSPVSLQGCVEPLLRETHFPSTRLGRQRLTHVFYGASAVPHSDKPSRSKRP
ncbi:MAG TPA: hypothetical protein VHZ95_04095, partial [Polyangiales bacterium]|nr:hypothetical protein [Polyangiales bacterium]